MSRPASTLRDRYRGQTVLITGGSGFLGRVVLEKLLRSLPDVEEVILLLRPRGRTQPAERVAEILGSSLFDRLRSERPGFAAWWPKKVTVAQGALGDPDLGMSREARAVLAGRITAILHMGAVASFDEPLDRVLEVNTLGTLDVLALAKEAGNVPMVHVSTAYVQGKRAGTHEEALLPRGHTPRSLQDGSDPTLDPGEVVAELLERCNSLRGEIAAGAHDDQAAARTPMTHLSEERLALLRREHGDKRLARLGCREATRRGWPDPYPMSKALAEKLLVRRRESVPLSVVRPAILCSTVREPNPGWLTGLRMADPIIAAMGNGFLDVFPGDPRTVLDLVPCDLAANAILAALPSPAAGTGEVRVFHVAGSDTNPLPLSRFVETCRTALERNPFLDRAGRPIRPSALILADPGTVRIALSRSRRRLAIKLAVFDRLGLKTRVRAVRSRLRFLRHAHILARAYAPYTTRQFRFRTEALEQLHASLCPDDQRSFPMSVRDVDWTAYLGGIHVPAVRAEAGGRPRA